MKSVTETEMGDKIRIEFLLQTDNWGTFIDKLELFSEAKDNKKDKRESI